MSYLAAWRPDLRLQPSQQLRLISFAVLLMLLVLLVCLPVHWGWRLSLVALLGGGFSFHYRRYLSLSADRAIVRVLWSEVGWCLHSRQRVIEACRLTGNSRLGRQAVLLHFYRPGSWHWGCKGCFPQFFFVPVFADSLDARSFHHLQLFLRWQPQTLINPC